MSERLWYCIQLSGLGERTKIGELKVAIIRSLKTRNLEFFFPVKNANNNQPYHKTESVLSGYFFVKAPSKTVLTRMLSVESNEFFKCVLTDWNVTNQYVQNLHLKVQGIEKISLIEPRTSLKSKQIRGNTIKKSDVGEPVCLWCFDEVSGDATQEAVSKADCEIEGHASMWKKGVS